MEAATREAGFQTGTKAPAVARRLRVFVDEVILEAFEQETAEPTAALVHVFQEVSV